MLVHLPPLKMHLYEISRCPKNTTSTYWQPVGSNILTSEHSFFFSWFFVCFNWWSLGFLPHLGYKWRWEDSWVFLWNVSIKLLWMGFAESINRYMFNCRRNYQTDLQMVCQQHKRSSFSCAYYMCCWSFFTAGLVAAVVAHWGTDYHYSDIVHLFMCYFSTYISAFVKCLSPWHA